jgi:LPXTG-motif cell wall-anchored protein
MTRRQGPRWPAPLLAAVAAAAGVLTAAAPTGAQQAGVEATADRATDLVDGDRVTVTVTGAGPGQWVDVTQCVGGVTDIFDGCDYYDFAGGPADASGSATLTVAVDTLLDTADGETVDCRDPGACSLVVGVDGGAAAAELPLHFVPDAPLAPPPVMTVTPDALLADRQTVSVVVTGMVWSTRARVTQCATAAVDYRLCDTEVAAYAEVVGGAVTVDLAVSAVLDTYEGGAVDCREPGACIVVASSGFGRIAGKSATAPVTFDPATVVVPATLTVEPAADLVDGQTVTVTGAGFTPGFVALYQCGPDPADGSCRWSGSGADVAADGTFSVTAQVQAILDTDAGQVDCRTSDPRCQMVATAGSPASLRAGRAELGFVPDGPVRPGPAVTVTPSTDLADPAVVTVTASGLSPHGFAAVAVCAAGTSHCDPEADTYVDVDPQGAAGPVTLGVAGTFTAGDGTAVDCRADPGCAVVVRDELGGRSGSAPLSFAPAVAPTERYRQPVFDEVTVTRDVVYRETTDASGAPVELRLDVYEPAGDTAAQRPVVAWLPGGWFTGRPRGDMAAYAEDFARKGYVAVTVDYRQRPGLRCCPTDDAPGVEAALLDAHDDAAAAVTWLRDNAAEYRIDPRAVAVGGDEAGASAALALAHLPGQMGRSGPSPVAAAVGIQGVDLGWPDAGEPAVLALHGDDNLAPLHLSTFACARAGRVGVGCETVDYEGVWDVATSRRRDVLHRSTEFLAATMLAPLGYVEGAAGPATPAGPAVPGADAEAGPTTTTVAARTSARGTLPQTGTSATGTLVAVAVGLGVLGAVLVVVTRARRRGDEGDLRVAGAVAVGAVALLVVGALMTFGSSPTDRTADEEAAEHDMSSHDEDDDHASDHDKTVTGDGHDTESGNDHDMDAHDADSHAGGSGSGHSGSHGTARHGSSSGHGHRSSGSGGGSAHGHGTGGDHDGTGGDHDGTGGDHDGTGGEHGHGPTAPGEPPHPHDPGHPPDPHDPDDPPHPPDPPDNGFDPDWTPEQVAYAQGLIDGTTDALPQYANTAVLPLVGYVWIFDGTEIGTYQHWIHLSRIGDPRRLDPAAPESLVFRTTDDGPVLEAAMYMLSPGYTLANVPADIAWLPGWHVHDNLCFENGFELVGLAVNGVCARGTLIITPPMVHVWIVDTPCGRFAGVDEHGLQCHNEHGSVAAAIAETVTPAPPGRGEVPAPSPPAAPGL